MAIQFSDKFELRFGYPWVPLPSDEEAANMTTENIVKFMEIWNGINEGGKKSPIASGWTLPSWETIFDNYQKYNILIMLGGNASGKSFFGARSVLSLAAKIPEASIACFSPTAETSVADQQKLVWDALPDSLKNLPTKKGQNWNLSWSQKNGFTDNVCILPPLPGYRSGSSIRFYSYSQYYQNDAFIEGKRWHYVWLDEACPLGLLNTIRLGRIGAFHGRIFWSYTIVDQWNDAMDKVMGKVRTLKKRFCDHPKIMHDLPVLQESLSMDSTLVTYAWSKDNPFCDYSEFLKLNSAESKEVILMRGFGVPTRLTTSAFPNFDKDVNVIKHEELPWLKAPKKNARGQDIPYRVTRYFSVDPGGSKSWFMLWGAVDASGTWWIYREYPDISYGEWALPGDKAGPAQKGTGLSEERYAEIIKQAEDGEEIMERYIDPRMGANERGGKTIMGELEEAGIITLAATVASSEANKTEIQSGIQLINSLLHWDSTKEKSFTNAPKLYISDRCENLIYCLQEFTGALGGEEATKDGFDALRYMLKSNIGFVDPDVKDHSQTGVY